MVDLQNTPITEPSAMKKICIASSKTTFPCYTQAVERTIKLVTEASSSVLVEDRDCFVHASIEEMKNFQSLKQKKVSNSKSN